MQAVVSITSQGQITVPASMRRYLGVNKREKVKATLVGEKIVLERLVSIDDLAGALAKRARTINKGLTFDEVVAREKRAAEQGWSSRFAK